MMDKMYISVRGGCVNGVLSTNPHLEVELWDWDSIEAECSSDEVKACEKEWDELTKDLYSVL